ncbi:zinc-binding dehydrogenase, partial [Pseudomonas peli]|uniref:zinc-binding dehydrogenase n=1 Tax=Pseudomonas peli TaxID=592361 RepID=UPI003D314EBD
RTRGASAASSDVYKRQLQGGETILFHAAAGGVGSFACQWGRALGVKLIGTVSSAEKAARAKEQGAWATFDYILENFAHLVLVLSAVFYTHFFAHVQNCL